MQISGDFQWKSQVFLPCLLPVRGPSMFCYDLFFWQPACSIFLARVFMTYVWFLLKQQKTAQGWGWVFFERVIVFFLFLLGTMQRVIWKPWFQWNFAEGLMEVSDQLGVTGQMVYPPGGREDEICSHGWALKGDTAPQDTFSSRRKMRF